MLCERLDGRTRILLKKQGVYDIMSVSEPEACLHGYGERRMSIMIAAKAASSRLDEGLMTDVLDEFDHALGRDRNVDSDDKNGTPGKVL